MKRDQEIFDIIEREHQRQAKGIELIASENFVSDQVMQAMGSCLTNKYAEGYPGKRYYGGCEVVDEAESLAIARIKKLFGAEYANVQPTPEHRPTQPFSRQYLCRVRHSWDLTLHTAVTCHTVQPSTHQVSFTMP